MPSGGGSILPWATQVKALIRRRYTHVAAGVAPASDPGRRAVDAGYPEEWLAGLSPSLIAAYSGCGFVFGELDLSRVRSVVDLGCGAGLDARWIAERMPRAACVLAVDLTPAMARRAHEATRGLSPPARIVVGDMECLPLRDGTADLVVANAAFNLTLDKPRAFAEARRLLRPGGRLVAADLVRVGDLAPELRQDPMAFNTSLGGVLEEDDLRAAMIAAGFDSVRISGHRPFPPVVAVRLEAERS